MAMPWLYHLSGLANEGNRVYDDSMGRVTYYRDTPEYAEKLARIKESAGPTWQEAVSAGYITADGGLAKLPSMGAGLEAGDNNTWMPLDGSQVDPNTGQVRGHNGNPIYNDPVYGPITTIEAHPSGPFWESPLGLALLATGAMVAGGLALNAAIGAPGTVAGAVVDSAAGAVPNITGTATIGGASGTGGGILSGPGTVGAGTTAAGTVPNITGTNTIGGVTGTGGGILGPTTIPGVTGTGTIGGTTAAGTAATTGTGLLNTATNVLTNPSVIAGLVSAGAGALPLLIPGNTSGPPPSNAGTATGPGPTVNTNPGGTVGTTPSGTTASGGVNFGGTYKPNTPGLYPNLQAQLEASMNPQYPDPNRNRWAFANNLPMPTFAPQTGSFGGPGAPPPYGPPGGSAPPPVAPPTTPPPTTPPYTPPTYPSSTTHPGSGTYGGTDPRISTPGGGLLPGGGTTGGRTSTPTGGLLNSGSTGLAQPTAHILTAPPRTTPTATAPQTSGLLGNTAPAGQTDTTSTGVLSRPMPTGASDWWSSYQFANPTEPWQQAFNALPNAEARMGLLTAQMRGGDSSIGRAGNTGGTNAFYSATGDDALRRQLVNYANYGDRSAAIQGNTLTVGGQTYTLPTALTGRFNFTAPSG